MHDLSLMADLVTIFAAAVGVVLVLSPLGVPSVAGLILAGILIGPYALAWVGDAKRVEALSEVGVILLLFCVGLELPYGRLKLLFRPMLLGGTLQVTLTCVATLLIARAFALNVVEATVLALTTAPSSTAIVLRQLEARGEIDAPHGKQSLGILLFQDFCVVPMMLVLAALTDPLHRDATSLVVGLLRSLLVLCSVALLARLLVPSALRIVASVKKRDVFVLGLLVVGLGTAWAASLAGVSLSLGAFLAGVVIAGSHYRHQALADLIPFREVFASLFFISSGMLLDTGLLLRAPRLVGAVLLCIVIGKAVIVLAIGCLMRLSLRVAIVSALSLAQVGEFALVLLSLARERQALPSRIEDPLFAAVILSMLATPLLLVAAPKLATLAERIPLFSRLFAHVTREPRLLPTLLNHVIIAGYGVAGRSLAHRLRAEGADVVVVDLNARSVSEASSDGFHALYGDIATEELLTHVAAKNASELVLLINDASALERAVAAARRVADTLVITVRSRYQGEVAHLVALGATHVVAAEVEAGRTITEQILRRSFPPP